MNAEEFAALTAAPNMGELILVLMAVLALVAVWDWS
jgi:hypothetical protein